MSDGSGSKWQCVRCYIELPKAPPVPQCPYCFALQPGAVLEPFQTDPAVSVQPFYQFGTGGSHNYSPQFIPVQEQSHEVRVCMHCRSYLPPNSKTCTFCASWSQGAPEQFQQMPQNQQKGQRSSHNIVYCSMCGEEFKPGYKTCAKCGSQAPRNQPQGPPCVHCGELLIKKDASMCVKCGRVQPGNVKPSNPPTTPVSLPPGLFQGRNTTNTSHSHSATPQPNIPHSVPYPNYNFPRMFGPFASNLGSWPRMPTPLQHVQCSSMGNNQPSLEASHTNVPSSTQQLTVSHETGVSVNQPSQRFADNNSKNLPGFPSSARPSSNLPGGDTVKSDPKDVVQTSKDHQDLQNLSKQAQQPVSTSAHNMNNEPDKSTTEENIKGSTDKPITTSASSSAVTTTTTSNSASIASTSPTTTTIPAKASYAGVVKGQIQPEGSDANNNMSPQTNDGHQNPTQDHLRTPNLDGLKAPDTNSSLKLTFHAIVPHAYWEWDANSKIYIRFGHSSLGMWKENCGQFQIRKIDDLYSEVWCTFETFDARLFKSDAGIPYKYVVYSPKVVEKDDWFEFLHAHNNYGDPNRYIKLVKKKSHGEYHKYDSIVYPKKTRVSRSWRERLTSTLSGLFGWKKAHNGDEEFIPLTFLEMSKVCLNIYLGNYRSMICDGNFQHDLNLVQVSNNITCVFSCLRDYWIEAGGTGQMVQPKPNEFKEVMKSWLMSLVTHIEQNPLSVSGKQLTAVFLILSCLVNCYPNYQQLSNKFILSLIRMLTFNHNTLARSQCPDYDFLVNCLQNKTFKNTTVIQPIVTYLAHLYKRIAEQKSDSLDLLEWMAALPLYHFLTKQSRPFEKVSVETKVNWERHKEIGLMELKVKTSNMKSFVKYYDDLKPYFALDPLLCPLFIYLTPDDDFPTLCKTFHPFLTLPVLETKVVRIKGVTKQEEKKLSLNIECVMNSLGRENMENDPSGLPVVSKASILIFEHFSKMKALADHIVTLLAKSSLLTLCVVAQLDAVNDQESQWQCQEREAILDRLQRGIKGWIADKGVIGGSMFGGSVPLYGSAMQWKDKSKKELHIWNTLLLIDTPTPRVCEDWNTIIKQLVSNRISSESPQLKIEIVCMMEDIENISDVLADTVMKAGYKAIDDLFEETIDLQSQHCQHRELESLGKRESKRVGMLLGRLLQKRYPNASDVNQISFSELLAWHMWPIFITIFVSKPILRAGIPEDYQVAGLCAQICLESMCEILESGEISVEELHLVKQHNDRMKRLCLAMSSGDESTWYETVVRATKKRLEEYTAFNCRREALMHLCSRIHPINDKVKGLLELEAELQTDVSKESICTLCVRNENDELQLICFLSAGSLLKFANDFKVVSGQKYGNDLFSDLWRSTMLTARANSPELTLDNIYSLVWQPCIQQCQQLLDSLMDMSIKLSDVDDLLCSHNVRLETQLHSLFKGINEITQKTPSSSLIDRATQRIRNYWELRKYKKGAEIFLKLKDSLGLTQGDFRQVERLSQQLSTSVKKQTLQDVDDNLVNTGKFLQDFAKDSRKVACLEKFAECRGIVKWLRTETKDVGDIQRFVIVALATAAGGEGDLSHDMLSHLRTVGGGYAPLIYQFPEDASFAHLMKACASVWDALNKNEKLPNLLEYCNKNIRWYQSVKKTQGSIEFTSYGQMRNILRYGCYNVGISTQSKSVHSIHDLIFLKLYPGDEQLTKTCYNLDELRDLESKLVLITGRKAENTVEVDHYLNILHHVTRIAELLLALQRAGSVKYSWWNVKFNCALYTVVDDGQKQELMLQEEAASKQVAQLHNFARSMEEALREWENEVKESRSRHYELNYYTTLQLLKLRKELGLLRICPDKLVIPEILALLESISQNVSSYDVQKIMSELSTQFCRVQVSVDVPPNGFHGAESDIHESISIPAEMESAGTNSVIEISEPAVALASLLSASQTSDKELSENVKPCLTEQDLSNEQMKIFIDLVDYQGYSSLLVLKAFEESAKSANQYDIYDWCDANYAKFNFEEEDSSEELNGTDNELSSLPDSDDSSEVQFTRNIKPSYLASSHVNSGHHSSQVVVSDVTVVYRKIINESHPLVRQLVDEFEYDLEASIEAVQLFGTLDKALDYLAKKDAENDGETAITLSLPVSGPIPEERDNFVVSNDTEAEATYLSLDELGVVLGKLNQQLPASLNRKRTFNDELKPGCPNLIVMPPCDVLKTVLALYIEDQDLPLPTLEEVLICDPSTTAEEVNLLWQRAIGDPDYRRIFCLVHAETLSYHTSDKVLESLRKFSQGKQDYRLVIICAKEDEDKSQNIIVSKLQLHQKSFVLTHGDLVYQKYLKDHFTCSSSSSLEVNASVVDHENSYVRVVCSKRAGMGKSLYIQRMAEQLSRHLNKSSENMNHKAVIPIHGPVASPDLVLKFLKQHYKDERCMIYHFDIAPNILSEVDTILFKLLILSGLTDSQGCVWRYHPGQMYTVEVTLLRTRRASEASRCIDLLNLLPTVECLTPNEVMKISSPSPFLIGMDHEEFRSSTFQRVYQYLRRHSRGQKLDKFMYQENVEGTTEDCLNHFLRDCGVHDPSWCEIHHFAKFLDLQLESCEKSVFCNEDLVGDIMSGLKGFIVKFMIRMSRDFATPSLHCEVDRIDEDYQTLPSSGKIEEYTIEERKKWEQCSHPYIFFNNDGQSITFVGFIITKERNLVDPRKTVLEKCVMTKELYSGLERQGVDFLDDCHKWKRPTMIDRLVKVMGVSFDRDPDETYVLTVDNLIKMLAIQMRFRCGIPVVIMGETGCGKTRLIRYMCDLARQGQEKRNMFILKVHGGVTEEDVIKFMTIAEGEARKNKENGLDTVVFFDEANTTDAIGLIKEIMCDRRIHGRPVFEHINFIAACNPYRRHSNEMIKKLREAGLGFYVEASKTKQRLGHIPLRELVYRVFDLPPSMRALVYDFGQLKKGTEDDYIEHIVLDHVMKHPKLSTENSAIVSAIAKVLATSQAYMRERTDECSFVSLRDVERAMIVFKYFYEKMSHFRQADSSLVETDKEEHPSDLTSALILAVSVCYHSRLQQRDHYEKVVSSVFKAPLTLPGKVAQFKNEITWCQTVLLDNMEVGPNIAKNAALRENVFMIAICIELKIPLFLVGKPGSSKSLAKSIIQDSMHGDDSHTPLLQCFKRVQMFSYQCSKLATSESVIEVFNSAKKFQSKQNVSVVVLDEVGLAEDSPNLPLKALHPLLEDGTEGAGAEGKDEIIAREERVAFIGISNWALDPAKMNRGVMVTRGVPDIEELELSARGICGKEANDQIKSKLEPYFRPLAEAYKAICDQQKREFFGLRDFYSLIKMLYWMCKETRGLPLTWPQMKHAIMRNFGGLKSDEMNPFEEFRKRLMMSEGELDPNDYAHFEMVSQWSLINPDCSRLGLIKTSLNTKDTTFHGENRYLLFLTENNVALDILKHYIRGKKQGESNRSSEESKPFILFGSSFPKDKEYTQVCRNINQIKICMETGRTVILLNLENLYESLYDVLNQYYLHYGELRYVDLGLQTHRVKCRVHKDFKLILIAERSTVYKQFPTPLINRLEKHFVLTSSVLKRWQVEVLWHFQHWIDRFSEVTTDNYSEKRSFNRSYAFIGYHEDTPAAVIFQASQQLKKFSKGDYWKRDLLQDDGILGDIGELTIEQKGTDNWKKAVLKLSQYLLLQTASDDSLVRLKRTALAGQQEKLLQQYFSQRQHSSIVDFVNYQLQNDSRMNEGLLMQVTTHGHLLLQEELESFLEMNVESFLLQEFDTELDFTNKVSPLFQRSVDENSLIVIQCDSGHLNGDLIACARYRIYDVRINARKKTKESTCVTHVLFIINLPHHISNSSFVGFQGDPWITAHIDDLRPTSEDTVDLTQALSSTISELFIGEFIDDIAPFFSAPVTAVPQQLYESENEENSIEEDILTEHSSSPTMKPADTIEETEHVSDDEDISVTSRDIQQAHPEMQTMAASPQGSQNELSLVQLLETEEDSDWSELPYFHEEEQTFKELFEDTLVAEPTNEMEVIDIEEDEIEFAGSDESQDTKILQSSYRSMYSQESAGMESGDEDDNVHVFSPDESLQDNNLDTTDQLDVQESAVQREDQQFPEMHRHRTPVAQCRRLYNCIQAAASRVEDLTKDRSIQRVTRLTKLLKRSPNHLDPNSFHGVLILHIYHLLQEREYNRVDLSDWVLTEAMNTSSLEVGGTFRNVLARKIDDVVIHIFSHIIASIDQNYNLDLLNPKAIESPLNRFWLAMFMDPKIQKFSYAEMAQGGKVAGLGIRRLQQDFSCKLPFFWLIKDTVDSQWDYARSHAGMSKQTHHQQLCELVQDTPVGAVLESVHSEDFEEFYKFYLHDFVKSVHKCNHKRMEHNSMELTLISDALDHIVHSSEFQHYSLISMIAALHVAYGTNKSHILWFGQLVFHSPSIMQSLVEMFPSEGHPEMELQLYAAEKMIEKLEPPLQKDNPNPNLVQWLNNVRLSQNTIESILNLKPQTERVLKSRHGWCRLRATQLFVENVMIKHSEVDLKLLARRLCARWKGSCDFTKFDTVTAVQLQLNSVEKLLKRDCNDKAIIREVKKSCRGFFMEVVSDLCFKGQAPPEPDLVKMLLNTVFVEKDEVSISTKDLTPYKDEKIDKVPTIRSFLLQLLLEHSMDQVRHHLKDYLDKSYRLLEGCQRKATDHNLYLLIIQCFEDAQSRNLTFHHMTANLMLENVTKCLIEGYTALQEHVHGTPTLEYLEGVAKVRHSLSVVAEVLKSEDTGHQIMELLRAAARMCSDRDVNCIDPTGRRDTIGPVIYLLKLLVRQYGMPCLKAAAEVHDWIIPVELRSDQEKSIDPFAIYEELYKSLREALNDCMYGNQMEPILKITQNLKPYEVVYFLLALYEKATLSRTTNNAATKISDDALERLDGFILSYRLLSNELRLAARALLANEQGGRALEQMFVSPQQPLHCRTILSVVVHAAAVFYGRQKVDILLPFVNILNNPVLLQQSYLPTMQEDPLLESHGAMLATKEDKSGKFYECPNGHKYFVGNCGGTYYTGVCNVCAAPIGGTSGTPVAGNKLTNTKDTTAQGYDLGAPGNRTICAPERNLSARAVCILRALMHSAFIWASCNNSAVLEAIASLVTPQVLPQHLPEFFWAHLEKDLELLSNDTGRGLDEAVMIVHLVLQRILMESPPIGGNVQTVSTLAKREARKDWERIFNEHYLHPVLSKLDQKLDTAMDCVTNDKQQDHDQLFYLVYEKVNYPEESLDPHLWTYRSRITLEHLRQTVQEMKDRYPILHEFLKAETELRATQYLPDISRLQQCLYDKFNHQIDRMDVKNQTIAIFLKSLPNETIKNEYREMIDSVKAAWTLVGHRLKNHSLLPVNEKYFIAAIDDNTPMEYLVPTASRDGPGVCTMALVHFLTVTHNDFIERCRSIVAENDHSSLNFWHENKIPITHLHRCHLLDYEHQLPSIILSHCHYSLKVGRGQDVKYDHRALERHILNRFIHGKPMILIEIPQVVYRKDIYTTGTFADVRKKVEPQEQLQPRVKKDIIAELCTPDRLREALDVVEIVLGFLSSGGGKADKPLGEYINKTLKMRKRNFSQKAKSSCQLKHTLSLWETIAVELARQLCLRRQEPFDSIRQEFLRELSKDEDGEDQFTELNRCLGQFDPDLLLGTIYEFIETYIKHCPQHLHDQPLVDMLEVVLDQHGTDDEPPQWKKLPKSLKLDQAVAAWKHIVFYYADKN